MKKIKLFLILTLVLIITMVVGVQAVLAADQVVTGNLSVSGNVYSSGNYYLNSVIDGWPDKLYFDGGFGTYITVPDRGNKQSLQFYIDNSATIGATTPVKRMEITADGTAKLYGGLVVTSTNYSAFSPLVFLNSGNGSGAKGYRIALDNNRLTFQNTNDDGTWKGNQMVIYPITGNMTIGMPPSVRDARLDVWGGNLLVTGSDVNGTAYITSKAGTAYFSNNSYNNGIAVASDGKVGIGTTAPKTSLQVALTTAPVSTVTPLGVSTNATLYITNRDLAYGLLTGVLSSGNVFQQVQRTDGLPNTYNLLLQPNGGKVGIGVVAPERKLDVNGEVKFGCGDWGNIYGYTNTCVKTYQIAASNGNTFFNGGGNFGIGTNEPGYVFHLVGPNTPMMLETADTNVQIKLKTNTPVANGKVKFIRNEQGNIFLGSYNDAQTTSVVQMMINNSGKVGIGTTNPLAALQVAGNVNIFANAAGTFTQGNSVTLNLGDTSNNIYVENGQPMSLGAWNGFVFRTNVPGSDPPVFADRVTITSDGTVKIDGNNTLKAANLANLQVISGPARSDGKNLSEVILKTPSGSSENSGDQVVLDFLDTANSINVKNGQGMILNGFNGFSFRTYKDATLGWVNNLAINKNGALTNPNSANTEVAIQTPSGSWASVADKVTLNLGDSNNNIFVQYGQPVYLAGYNGFSFRTHNADGSFSEKAAISQEGTLKAISFSCTSDIRQKKNIKTVDNALDQVLAMRGVSFNWKTQGNNDKKNLGFIAQEVEKITPELVEVDSSGYKTMNYDGVSALLVNAIQEQNQQIEQLINRVDKLEKENQTLKSRIK